MFSFSSQVVGKVQHGRLSKYFFENLEAVFPAGKVVTAKILRSVGIPVIYAAWQVAAHSRQCCQPSRFSWKPPDFEAHITTVRFFTRT